MRMNLISWREMLEGLVRQLLLGYLGQYVKDIQREQLKITLWNEEVLLENVELILEAFDHLRLPFALKEGRVGRLSIRIPWKKLGWEPIIIVLEDVFIGASERGDEEWSAEAVERRELAGKKAKLMAAELAKLSSRVDSQAGKSFISYISAKILENIQVSIRNFHVQYHAIQSELQSYSAQLTLGLRFSSLTIMNQSLGMRVGMANKIVEITGLEVYCDSFSRASSLMIGNSTEDDRCWTNDNCESNRNCPILAPLNVSISLSVNRSGKLDADTPQWSVSAEITSLVICLDDFQLRQILILLDNLCISQLREQYGRFRPWSSPLSRKLMNWQKLWWHYAQESVLSDVRKKLRKISWRYLGQRVEFRRRYVELYKKKLVFLRQEQPVDEHILQELEQMERQADIEDILSHRSVAEHKLQELFPKSELVLEKSRSDDRSSGGARGWLNWLSRGMLGAGGTEDSGQFSGVVSDEVIKDIYEATEFQPPAIPNEGTIADDNMCRCKVKFLVHHISATLLNTNSGKHVVEFICEEAVVECTLREGSAFTIAGISNIKIVYPHDNNMVLHIGGGTDHPSCKIYINVSPHQEVGLLIKVAIQPLRVILAVDFFLNLEEFLDSINSFLFQHERVLLSLDGIEDDRARILSKAEYVLSSHRKVAWDVSIMDVILNVPWSNANGEHYEMSLELGAIFIKSKSDVDEDQPHVSKGFLFSLPKRDLMGLKLRDLYNRFEVKVDDSEVKIIQPSHFDPVVILEKFSAFSILASCIIVDKLIPKGFEAFVSISTLDVHFSPSIYLTVLELVMYLHRVCAQYEQVSDRSLSLQPKWVNKRSPTFGFSVAANSGTFILHIDLENKEAKCSKCILSMKGIDIRYDCTEVLNCYISAKAFKILSCPLRNDSGGHTLCSFGTMSGTSALHHYDITVGMSDVSKINNETVTSTDPCLSLHYETLRRGTSSFDKCIICLKDGDLHCYPYIFGVVVDFFDRLSNYGLPPIGESSSHLVDDRETFITSPDFGSERFGFSNFNEAGSSKHASILVDSFPFVTITGSGFFNSLENSLLYPIAEWRSNFSTRTRKPSNLESIMRKSSQISLSSSFKPSFGLDACGVKVHFHDSSGTIGIITLPTVSSAVFLNQDSVDILCSTEGLVLTSSWWTDSMHEFLWGPSSKNYSPIVNAHVRKGSTYLSSQLEVSIGIQHVCCVLPPEYLAILVGYFSLPEWTLNSCKDLRGENGGNFCTDNRSEVIYKFEILDSEVIVPEKEKGSHFLKLESPQLYCSFVGVGSLNGLLEDIPPECLSPEHKIPKQSHCLNLFGRQLSLLFFSSKDDGVDHLGLHQCSGCRKITLLETLSADVWLRIPQENATTSEGVCTSLCIMGKIYVCEVFADDKSFLGGVEALLTVINQFSSVQDESKYFTSDVLQFLQSRRSENVHTTILPITSSELCTVIVLSVDSLSVKLHHSTRDSIILEPVARAEIQFKCSLSMRNETPEYLNLNFSSVALYSLCSSAILARCRVSQSASLVVGINFSKFDQVETKVAIFLHPLDVWLEFSEWKKVLHIINSFLVDVTKIANREASSKEVGQALNFDENAELIVSESSPNCASADGVVLESAKQNCYFLIVRMENVDVTFRLGIDVSTFCYESGEYESRQAGHHNTSTNMVGRNHCRFAALTIQSKSTVLYVGQRNCNLKSIVENISMVVEIIEDSSLRSCPFFQISQVTIVAEIYHGQTENTHVTTEVQCDHVDVGFSHQIFSFWHGIALNDPVEGSPQTAIWCMDCKLHVRKVSVLLTDGRWSCRGPLLETLMRNLVFHANVCKTIVDASIASDLEVNYNNIHKVMWEPFIEPWKFQASISRKREISVLLNSSIITDVKVSSLTQLNLNFTESFLEPACRAFEMIQSAWDVDKPMDLYGSQTFLNSPYTEEASARAYAPYTLQNLTSLPLAYCVCQGSGDSVEPDAKEMKHWNVVQPGCSVPVYSDETPEERMLRCRPAHTSDCLNEKQSSGVSHHFISVQLDGISMPSMPLSMDLVGLSYFEIDFSKASNQLEVGKSGVTPIHVNLEEDSKTNPRKGFVVPVVLDVSVRRFTKLICIYSTVIVYNKTSVPLELRFDIPLGVSPKIIDPIYPGQKFPLPLHLAEAGRIRWRPLGNNYVWSEPHDLPSVLSQDSKIGSLRSFVCYPSHLSNDPFRCCFSVEKMHLPPFSKPKKVSDGLTKDISKEHAVEHGDLSLDPEKSPKRFIYQLNLSTPFVVHNYLPQEVSLSIESGGVSRVALLSEVKTNFHHIDPSHELTIEFRMEVFKPSVSRFPPAESFSVLAKLIGTKFIVSENLTFDLILPDGSMYIAVEKTMDAYSGARELTIFVPYLLYNCVGFPLNVSDCSSGGKESVSTIPSSYDLVEQEQVHMRKEGFSLLSFNPDSQHVSSDASISPVPTKKTTRLDRKPLITLGPFGKKVEDHGSSFLPPREALNTSNQSSLSDLNTVDDDHGKVKGYAYSPHPSSSLVDNLVRLSRSLPKYIRGKMSGNLWSNPFPLVPASGSTSVLVPQPLPNAAYVIAVSSAALSEPFDEKTRAIIFQPRYVICNACGKELCYKQKGTGSVFILGKGKHSHLHWADTTRDLMVSICYDEPGWQWSGSFLPETLGDTLLKMRNYITGALKMIRVEVQSADISMWNENVAISLHKNSGTHLILLSDDDSGYMPYRIENFSKERLRVYQQKCESFETTVHPYHSCPYAWDEPCYPHRLIVEVPGERAVGSFALDDVNESTAVHLPPTSEMRERTLLISVHAEGATKVLSIVDSSYHVNPSIESKKLEQKPEIFAEYKEKVSVDIPYIGISLVNSFPQELLFACAKGITIDLLQSTEQQKLYFQVMSLQVDNQIRGSTYPVILSFDHGYKSSSITSDDAHKSENLQLHSDNLNKSVMHLAVSKWRKKDLTLISFEYITFRVAQFHLELEQEVVLGLFDFFKLVYLRFQNGVLPFSDPTVLPLLGDVHLPVKAQSHLPNGSSQIMNKNQSSVSLPSIVPIGAPWQQIYHLARRQKKIYVEMFDVGAVKFTLSFSSAPWMLRVGIPMSGDSVMPRGLMALADIEGARIYLRDLRIVHHMAGLESIQEILMRHYTRQLLHEMYKVLGAAGVIGNPMGFARSLGHGIRDFVSVPTRNFLQSPAGLIKGMAQGTTSLLTNTVYALSDAATQFSRAAQKGIVALTYDEKAVAKMEKQQKGAVSHSEGIINEVLEGLTGLLESPIREAEKHGLPGVLSGAALGLTGLVARPAASILEVTGKTAQSIRNRSKHYQMGAKRRRVRLPRPLSNDFPLRPYSWEEAIGASVLTEAGNGFRFKDEALVICRALKQAGKFVIVTKSLILLVSCSSLVDFGKSQFQGIESDPAWDIESEIRLDSVIHIDTNDGIVHIVRSGSDALWRQSLHQAKRSGRMRVDRDGPPTFPLFQIDLEFASAKDAGQILETLLSVIRLGKERGWGSGSVLHCTNVK